MSDFFTVANTPGSTISNVRHRRNVFLANEDVEMCDAVVDESIISFVIMERNDIALREKVMKLC